MSEVTAWDRVISISDLHLPPAARYGNFTSGAELVKWTRSQERSAGPGSLLVLNGDIVDFLLIEERSSRLDLVNTALFIQRALTRLDDLDWVADWKVALGTWLAKGGGLTLIPGNHDPEWLHPDAHGELARWLGVPADAPGLSIHRASGPLRCRVGAWEVVVGHGHRADPFNDIDPAAVIAALHAGEASLPLPPGSELVLGPVRQFKRAMDADGRRRFAFLDAVKPEWPAAFALLLYLDPALTLRSLPALFPLMRRQLVREVGRLLLAGPALDAAPATGEGGDELARDFVEALDPADRRAAVGTVGRLEEILDGGADTAAVGVLSGGLGRVRRAFLRAWLRRARSGMEQHDAMYQADGIDRRIIEEFLPDDGVPRVVLAGHTHAARQISLDERRCYLNTGTWTDLLDLSAVGETDDDLVSLHESLERGDVPKCRRWTSAEVTPSGPRLHSWT